MYRKAFVPYFNLYFHIPLTLPKLTIAFKFNLVMLNATKRWVVQNYFAIIDIYDIHTAE